MTFPDHGLVLDQPYVSVSRKVASRQSRSSWSRSALRSNSTPERGFLRCSRSLEDLFVPSLMSELVKVRHCAFATL